MAFFLTVDGWADEACQVPPVVQGTRSYSDFGWYPLTELPANMIDRGPGRRPQLRGGRPLLDLPCVRHVVAS